MCTPAGIIASFSAAAAAIGVAAGLVFAAAAANASFWVSYTATPLLAGAAAVTFTAAGLIIAGLVAFGLYLNCKRNSIPTGSLPPNSLVTFQQVCVGELTALTIALGTIETALMAQGFAAVGILPWSWVPFAAAGPISVVATALVAQAIAILPAIILAITSINCVEQAYAKP